MTSERGDEMNKIDAALRVLGGAVPEPGIEGRILTRLAAARVEPHGTTARLRREHRMPRFFGPLVGFTSAGLVCGVIVVGSVRHSHAHRPGVQAVPAVLQIQGAGVGAASAVHPANPGTAAPVPASPTARGRASHRATQRGRARIGAHAKKAPGVAVPAPGGTREP